MKTLSIGLAAFIIGVATIPAIAYVYLRFGTPPVAVTDPAFPQEKAIVHVPLNARIDREMPREVPFTATEENLVAGASIYRQQCAVCHGVPSHPAAIGDHMYPHAPALWASHRPGVVGVSDDPAGESYWKVKNGIRLAGMPAYADLLSDKQMWQVTLLVKNADQPLNPAVATELNR